MSEFDIISVNISEKKGTVKHPVDTITIREEHGIQGDAHAGKWHRQISLLGIESIEKMRSRGMAIGPGDCAENITTKGITLYELPLGTELYINGCVLEVTQIGKKCHSGCEIAEKTGMCIMPTEGIFTTVIKGGDIRAEDRGHYSI